MKVSSLIGKLLSANDKAVELYDRINPSVCIGERVSSSLKSRAEIVNYFSESVPDLECDFYLTVSGRGVTGSKIPVTDFSFPDAGVVYSSSDDMYGHLVPSYKTGNISIRYVVNKNADVLRSVWENQFVDGVPKFIPVAQRPAVRIYRKRDDTCIFVAYGCMFSTPVPGIQISGTNVAGYKIDVSFDEFSLL